MANESMYTAKNTVYDEFYTELPVIQAELSNYSDKFKGKTVYCNCDDPFESNFVKYFLMNFNRLGLKELIATGYKTSGVGGSELAIMSSPYAMRIKNTKAYLLGTQSDLDVNGAKRLLESEKGDVLFALEGNYATDENDQQIQVGFLEKYIDEDGVVKTKKVNGSLYYEAGDFRSDMSVSLLKESDIVVTNPPFSLSREFIAQLEAYQKKFLILSNYHAITYLDVFPLLKSNKIWAGCTNGSRVYAVSKKYARAYPNKVFYENGTAYSKMGNTLWLTNLDHEKRHQIIPLEMGYTYRNHEDMYPKYDNYDAIEVDKIAKIPSDYTGMMGVPNTFIEKFCPDQFELVGIPTAASNEGSLNLNKDYRSYIGYRVDGTPTGRTGSTFGAVPVFERNNHKTVYYTDGHRTVQAGSCERIFIRFTNEFIRSHPKQFGEECLKQEDINRDTNC